MTSNADVVHRGDLRIYPNQHTITVGGKRLELSATEFELLARLARAAPQVVTPQELAAEVQGYEGQTLQEANATLRYHFYRLRRKIKQQTGRDDLIKTIHGVGYALNQPADSELPSGVVTFLLVGLEEAGEGEDDGLDSLLIRSDLGIGNAEPRG